MKRLFLVLTLKWVLYSTSNATRKNGPLEKEPAVVYSRNARKLAIEVDPFFFKFLSTDSVHWKIDTRASSGLWLLWRESDNPHSGPLNQARQRIVKWKGEKRMKSLKGPLMHMIHSWTASANRQIVYFFKEFLLRKLLF